MHIPGSENMAKANFSSPQVHIFVFEVLNFSLTILAKMFPLFHNVTVLSCHKTISH